MPTNEETLYYTSTAPDLSTTTDLGTGTLTYAWYDYSSNLNFSTGNYVTIGVDVETDKKTHKIKAEFYFKYLKKKLSLLEKMKLDRRMKNLEKAFDIAVETGQDVLAKKFLDRVVSTSIESELYAKGIKYYLDKYIIDKYKHRIKDGHIADTLLEDYTRKIPKNVIEKKKKVEHLFEKFIIYHYHNPELEEKREKKQEMSPEERSKMRDPILFGKTKYSDRYYFIGDWDDEECDLTFDEMIDAIGLEEEQISLSKKVNL